MKPKFENLKLNIENSMKISNFKLKIIQLSSPLAIIIFAVLLRLFPHLPNVAPIAAMALFGGVYLNKKYALLIPVIAMFISDFFLGFHPSMPMVYGSFLLTGLLGLAIKRKKNAYTILGGSLASSLIFFLLTNMNYWYATALYPKTFSGFIASYTNALPFFRNTILGDLLYNGIFFGSYELVLHVMFHKKVSPKQYDQNLHQNR